eukprot:15356433-Heterocapsa_arctica.AAC.1
MRALRMTQKQAMEFNKRQTSLVYIHVTLVNLAGQAGGTGYVLYRQMDKMEYSNCDRKGKCSRYKRTKLEHGRTRQGKKRRIDRG